MRQDYCACVFRSFDRLYYNINEMPAQNNMAVKVIDMTRLLATFRSVRGPRPSRWHFCVGVQYEKFVRSCFSV